MHTCLAGVAEPTVLLVHEGSLWRVGDALPDSDGLGVAGVHGFHLLTVPPVPIVMEKQHTQQGEGDVCSSSDTTPLPATRTRHHLRADVAAGRTVGPQHGLPCVCEHWVLLCIWSVC